LSPASSSPHQGFVLKCAPLEVSELDCLPVPKGHEHWLALDEVWDPQNLGALVRSAYFLGIKVRG
jgi:21S rRNA (GM2251-2'-O)-methyltransferase